MIKYALKRVKDGKFYTAFANYGSLNSAEMYNSVSAAALSNPLRHHIIQVQITREEGNRVGGGG